MHVEQLAARIHVQVGGAEASEQRVQLARQVRAGLGARARFRQSWKEGKQDSACIAVQELGSSTMLHSTRQPSKPRSPSSW